MTKLDPKEETVGDEFVSHVDWFLQSLVDSANRGGALPITLQVSGLLVSGVLVSGADYFAGFAEDFSSGLDGEEAAHVKASFDVMAESYRQRKDDEDASSLAKTQFIHLRDARFFSTSGSPIPANRGVWWRGRISAVGGFSLGTLAASKK